MFFENKYVYYRASLEENIFIMLIIEIYLKRIEVDF